MASMTLAATIALLWGALTIAATWLLWREAVKDHRRLLARRPVSPELQQAVANASAAITAMAPTFAEAGERMAEFGRLWREALDRERHRREGR